MLQAAFEDQCESVVKTQAAMLPVKRIDTAEEAARSILFLATTRFITGEVRASRWRRTLRVKSDPSGICEAARPMLLSHHHTYQGERLTYHGIYYAIGRIGNWAGLPDLHPHQFRPYASQLLAQGVNPMHAKRLTGHRSDQAFKRYVLRSEQEAAISAFYQALEESEKVED